MHAMGERVDVATDRSSDAPPSIGIVGGTGALGRGLASRLGTAGLRVTIGSRDLVRAQRCAAELGVGVLAASNVHACAHDLVIIAVPWSVHSETLAELAPALAGRTVIDAVNPIAFDDRGPYSLVVEAGSAAQEAQQLLPSSVVVGAFHHMSAELLESAGALDADVLVVGDDREAVVRVIAVIDAVPGLRGVYAGRLRNAGQIEALTANLIAINRRYRAKAGLRITGLNSLRPTSG
jgi:8-hydroxy-5-deazaflavin:NADPH oxidoreductase